MPRASEVHGGEAASNWVRRWSHLVPEGGSVLDVACGSGRHVRWFADRGCRVTAVDRNAAALAPLAALGDIVVADIEAGPWPFSGRSFDAVVITNYLWRARLLEVIASVGAGGVLIYETFATGNETIGKPSNPAFLLQPGELLRACAGLRVVAFEDGFEPASSDASARFVQRIVTVREIPLSAPPPPRYGLIPDESGGRLKSLDSEEPA